MLAELLRSASAAACCGERELCPAATQTLAGELLALQTELAKHAYPAAA